MTEPILPSRYDPVAVTLHWLIALCIIAMIPLGFFMGDLPEAIRGDGYTLHKSIGITVLALSIFRLIWRLLNPPPALPADMPPIERFLAHVAHWLLYFLIVAMPLSGWLMVSAMHQHPTVYFWSGEVPFLPMPGGIDAKATKALFAYYHRWLAYGALVLIVLHVGAALNHHVVRRDTILRRMLPRWLQRRA